MEFRILHKDDSIVVIQKPRGVPVHPHSDPRFRGDPKRTVLHNLGVQLGVYLFPVHRLDQATEGVLTFAVTQEAARALALEFREHRVEKRYIAICRGWITSHTQIDYPLKSDESDAVLPSTTKVAPLAHLELDVPSSRYPTSRFTMIEAYPSTGRFHQIRRHLAHLSHPLIGDTIYGEGHANRTFKMATEFEGLGLIAHRLAFKHPASGAVMRFSARFGGRWHPLFERFGVCPI